MKRTFLRQHGKAAFDLIEEAFHLLRSASPGTLAAYYLGSVPFVAGFLVFWTDMSSSPLASRHLGAATLGLTLLFLWMKFFHVRFARGLMAQLAGEPPPAWTWPQAWRTLAMQTVVQCTALFVLPLAALVLLPLAWTYAFYQNATILDGGENVRDLVRKAARQSRLWPGQNHLMLLILSAFGFFVFLNWFTAGFVAPQLLKIFFGVETVFTRSVFSMFNTTFFAAMAALTFLTVDPLIKACYVLRCFQGLAMDSGEDLRADLRQLALRVAVPAFLFFMGIAPLHAQETPPAQPPPVKSAELDRQIGEVIQQGKYAWRMPREKVEMPEEDKGLLQSFFDNIGKTLSDTLRAMNRALDKAMKWLDHVLRDFFDWLFGRKKQSDTAGEAGSWMTPQLLLLFGVLAVAASLLAIVASRVMKSRRQTGEVESEAVAAAPDLADENTAADELPEDEWTQLGRRLRASGDLRLALRAFYLASLAHLAGRGLITVRRSKSNREYERELRRRARSQPELTALFGENVGVFDRIWYGLHEANGEMLEHFLANVERMKAAA